MEAAKSMRLWEIASELDEIGEELVLAGGEVTPELGMRLDAMVAAAISGAAVVRGTGVEAALAVESRALWKVKRLVTGEE